MKKHTSDGRAASVWAILPTCIVKFGDIGVWYAAYVADRIGSGVWEEFDGIVWASLLVAYEPDKSTEVSFARANPGFCKFAICKEDICTRQSCRQDRVVSLWQSRR